MPEEPTEAATAAAAAPSSSSSKSINPHLTDPALAPFLAADFSTADYLNTTLPPFLPPSILSTKRPKNAVPLADLSAKTTTLLSMLDLQTQKLLSTLQSLTDEILRLQPRLGYEVDVLRSDVATLGEELEGTVAAKLTGVAAEGAKPRGLDRLQMLAQVRERVEEVVKVFGEAMDWSLGGVETEQESGSGATGKKKPPSPPPPPPTERVGVDKKPPGQNPAEEVLYLIAAGELENAQKKIESLRLLATVFDGTVEGPARHAVVDALDGKVKAALEKIRAKEEPVLPKERMTSEKKPEEKKEEGGGYYGLIEQLKGLRGIS